MRYMNVSKAPVAIVAPDGEKVDTLPGQASEISEAFEKKVRDGGNKAAIAQLDELVPAESREAKRARAEMEAENRRAHAEAGLPPPPPPALDPTEPGGAHGSAPASEDRPSGGGRGRRPS